jgi:hypothetical protein
MTTNEPLDIDSLTPDMHIIRSLRGAIDDTINDMIADALRDYLADGTIIDTNDNPHADDEERDEFLYQQFTKFEAIVMHNGPDISE